MQPVVQDIRYHVLPLLIRKRVLHLRHFPIRLIELLAEVVHVERVELALEIFMHVDKLAVGR